MASSDLSALPLGEVRGFNWVFLVDIIVCMILALFFLFYFNRFFATVVSYAIRAYTWHAYRAYIDIASLQISLLGGRLFFKSIRYHGHNQTVLVHDGYVTWRYWLRQVQDAEIFIKQGERSGRAASPVPTDDESDRNSEKSHARNRSVGKAETGNVTKRPHLPCRIEVKVSGVEAFLYNQTPIYDTVIANLSGDPHTNAAPNAPAATVHPDASSSAPSASQHDLEKPPTRRETAETQQTRSTGSEGGRGSIPAFLRLFPIQIECKKAAAAVGNAHTPSIFTAKLDHASGRIDADEAGSLDLYKLLFKFDFDNVNVAFKSNADFQMYQLQAAAQMSDQDGGDKTKKQRSFLGLHIGRRARKLSSRIRRLFTFRRSSNQSLRTASLLSNDELMDDVHTKLPGETHWQGLARYLDEAGANEHHEWDHVEYARFSQIVDCSKIRMRFYWDVPGKVRKGLDQFDDVNGTTPPEYGLDLFVEGGIVNYGPWADRQRVVLQQVFFPASYCDARPAQRRTSDQIRLATVFKLYLCLEKDITLRIPTRESSKDWQWQGRTESHRKPDASQAGLRKRHGKNSRNSGKSKSRKKSQQQQATGGPNIRPFGWIDVKVLADTTVNYFMDMYARDTEYRNILDVDVKGTEITSSVNHAMLWRAGNLVLKGNLSNPLGWNSLRKWTFSINCHDLDLFILRDHMFLMTDLIADWAAGPPPEFFTFIPYHYGLDINFSNYNLFLNGNDANIVNDPSDLEENNFLILRGQTLHCDLGIPIDQYRPAQGEVRFDVTSRGLSLDLSNSSKITLQSLLRDKRVADMEELTLKGTQTYFSEQAPGLTDVLRMDICGTNLSLRLFGFLIRYFVNVKENYFGEFLHFKTLEEYQNSGGDAANAEAIAMGRHTFRPANDLDVILCITAEHPVIMLPSNVYAGESYIKLELPTASADLRVTNYYLDLQTDTSPIAISWSGFPSEDDETVSSTPQILIDHANIVGHRLFGLPPTEPAYVENWVIDIGNISGDCSLGFVEHLANAGRAFAFTMADRENALPLAQTTPIPSILFMRLNTGSLCLWINDGVAATRVSSDPIRLSQNDRADELFSSRMTLNVPNLTLTCVQANSAARHRLRGHEEPAQCMAFIQTTIELNMVSRKAHFHAEYRKQQQHLRRQDARSRRAHFLLDKAPDGTVDDDDAEDDNFGEPPSMCLSSLPPPLTTPRQRSSRDTDSLSTGSSHGSFKTVGTQLPPMSAVPDHDLSEPGALPSLAQHRSASPQPMMPASTVKLWSQFAAPDDHFSHVNVDLSKVPTFTTTADLDDDISILSPSDEGFNLDANDDSEHQTFMIRLHPGVRVYVEPRISEPILNIVDAVMPKIPVDVMDKFQIDVIGEVEQEIQAKGSLGKITELNLVVPSVDVRLCNDREGDMATTPSNLAQDQLDLNLSYLNLTMRQRSSGADQPSDSALLLHLTLESGLAKLTNLSISESSEGVAIRLGVDDVLVWLVLSKTKSVHVSFKDLLTVITGQQAAYLASVFSKYATIGTSIQKRADAIEQATKTRLRYLADYLTSHSSATADPPYLSRMTYILRAFPDHYRNQDSWKIVARFRHIFDCLTDKCRSELEDGIARCLQSTSKPSYILDQWAEWCSWDIPNIGKTHVFRMLLGDTDIKEPEDITHPTELTLRAQTVRVSVDSGKKSSDVSLGGLSLALQIVPPSRPSGLMLVDENLRTKTVVQAHTALAMLRVNWEILDQADEFVDIYFKQIAPAIDILPEESSTNPETDENLFRQDVHVVMSNESVNMELETINLRHVSRAENLNVSVIGTSRASKEYGECATVLLTSGNAITEMFSDTSRVYHTQLTVPSIYLDYRQRTQGNAVEINVGGSYGDLSINIEREVVELLEIVDTIFVDEVSHIKRLQTSIANQHDDMPRRDSQNPAPAKALYFNVAFMAGTFNFSAALLQALNLSICGETANIRVRPRPKGESTFDIEAHLGSVEYALVRKEKHVTGEKAVFRTPPASAIVGVQILDERVNLAVTGTLQQILLEATHVQSALTILNRPEVQSVLEAIRDQTSDLRQRVAEVLSEETPELTETEAKEAKAVVYDVRITLAGFKIVASAPALSAGKARAELSFGLGNVRAIVSNAAQKESSGVPNISAQIQDIGALLTLIENGKRHKCGHVLFSIGVDCMSQEGESGLITREVKARSDALDIHVFAETASTIVDIVTHVQRKILDLDLSREVDYLRRLRHSREKRRLNKPPVDAEGVKSRKARETVETESTITNFSLDLRKIRLAWVVTESTEAYGATDRHDLELSFTRISLTLQRQNEARLSIQNLQLQVVPKDHPGFERAENSALLPEMVFTVRYATEPQGVKLAFNAAGQALDLRLDAGFVLPVSMVHKSITVATNRYHVATSNWRTESSPAGAARRNPFGDKRLISLQADAKFDGSHFYISGEPPSPSNPTLHVPQDDMTRVKSRKRGASRQVIDTTLRAPGMAIKIEFTDDGVEGLEPTLNGEIKVDASSNTVYPQLVPIVLQISDNIKSVVRNAESRSKSPAPPKVAHQLAQERAQDLLGEDSLLTKDPSALIGKMKLNLGLRICQQEFGFSCQPIARVNAKAQIEDIYITMSTINSEQFGHFFSLSATVTKLGASVQHVYSRESTFSFDMESIALSLMNSKHLGAGSSGVSAVLKIAPTRTALNVRQIQDLLLFREIWAPQELRSADAFGAAPQSHSHVQDEMLVQRYQHMSAAAAFPWNATLSIADLAVDLDLGQSIGKSSFTIKNMWASSKKSSTWKQDLCFGVDQVGINSTGRMSGFVELAQIAVRTSIEWADPDSSAHKAPLIQASVGFGKLRSKSSVDYQPFAFVDVEGFNLLFYNVRDRNHAPDRLVAILDGDKVFAFCTATSAAQAVGLYQAFDRLVQEKQSAYQQSLRDLEKQLKRRSINKPYEPIVPSLLPTPSPPLSPSNREDRERFPITLHSDVMVSLRTISFGAFPSSFFDAQILKLDASDVSARFAVGLEDSRIHSNLGLTLGQLQVALASVKKVSVPKTLGDISIDEVIANATGAKGGTILRVPKVVANMETWQAPEVHKIDYIFKSLFEGKVDVGWNYSRISFIRGMWNTHTRSLAARLGNALPESAVRIQSAPGPAERDDTATANAEQDTQGGKITAVVNVPQSRYEYFPLEPPIIETPQLRDMGEATPPLEWIGLNRGRLPGVVHQVVIVALLELAKELEDAYDGILGSS
ncbi:hypothetical protein BDV97DRAFT_360661 [Delphinella strobiligena]|nr:hypothetical protein BDV97DRAFT_360661 [Delphinella strobiligena]